MKTEVKYKKEIDLLAEFIINAQNDKNFKKNCIDNPRKSIKEYMGKEYILFDKHIVIEDQMDENFIYFNIPQEPNLDEIDLTEEQLEMISGGSTPLCAAAITSSSVCAYAAGGAVAGIAGYVIGRYT